MEAKEKKLGRPTDDPKINAIKLRLSDAYMDKIKFCQDKTGMTRADVIRRGVDKLYEELK